MSARHAYLILAHNEFAVLELLVEALDDVRNDLYIHLDRKVAQRPTLATRHAGLYWIEDPIDVRWGDVSVAEAEFRLFEAAARRASYSYYHLLSGVDLPLKSQDAIHSFFEQHAGKEFVGYYHGDDLETSLERKVHRVHLFPRHFKGSGAGHALRRMLRALYLRLQYILGIRRHRTIAFRKGTQWVSITDTLVRAMLADRDKILPLYRHSFCCDEIFIQTYLWHSPLSANIYNTADESRGCMRFIGWADNRLTDFARPDLERLRGSDALFARKFNGRDLAFLREVLKH